VPHTSITIRAIVRVLRNQYAAKDWGLCRVRISVPLATENEPVAAPNAGTGIGQVSTTLSSLTIMYAMNGSSGRSP